MCRGAAWIFDAPAKALGKKYHVFLAGAEGHDPLENTDFTSVEDYASKAVNALKKRNIHHLDGLYGLSMGGAAAMYLLAHYLIPVDKAIIDAGITPYPYPKGICRLISCRDFCLIPLAAMNEDVMKKIMPEERWTPEGKDPDMHYDKLYDYLKNHYSLKTNYNVFWSANNYDMPSSPVHTDTKMEYWYGSEEKRDRKGDIAYVKRMFPEAVIKEMQGYGHGEFVMIHPSSFAIEAERFFA